MNLTKSMIIVFRQVIHGKQTLQALSSSLQKSRNWLSEIITKLEKERFVNKRTKGRRKYITISGTEHSVKLKELMFKYPTVKFEDILSDSKLFFLAALSEDWITINEVLRLSGISSPMIRKYKLGLQNRGIIMKKKSLYRINSQAWPVLHDFVRAYKNYSLIPGSVKWKFQDELLFSVDSSQLRQGSPTGFSMYEKYGVKVGVVSILSKLPPKKLTKEEVFVHSLFEIDDSRTLYLAMTFFIKNRLKYNKVLPIAMYYGKYTMFGRIMKLFENKGMEGLPPFNKKDFNRVLEIYDVRANV